MSLLKATWLFLLLAKSLKESGLLLKFQFFRLSRGISVDI